MKELKAKFLGEREVAEITGWSLSKLRSDRFYRKGLPYYKIGRSVRYKYEDVIKYFEKSRISFEN